MSNPNSNQAIYQEHGYANRKEYLICLAEENDMSPADVFSLADLLGPDEDFDGLVCAVEDASMEGW